MKIKIFLFTLSINILSFAQIGINNTNPIVTLDVAGNPSNTSIFDGILFPRITGNDLYSKSYLASNNGTIIYVTAAASLPNLTAQTINVNAPGYYYFDGPSLRWIPMTGSSIITSFASQSSQDLAINSNTQTLTFLPSDSSINLASTFNDANDTFTIKYKGSYMVNAYLTINPHNLRSNPDDYIPVNVTIQKQAANTTAWLNITGMRYILKNFALGFFSLLTVPSTIVNLEEGDTLRFTITRTNISIGNPQHFGALPFGNHHIDSSSNLPISKMINIIKIK